MNRTTTLLRHCALSLLLAALPCSTALADPAATLTGNTLDKANPNATFTIRFAKPMTDPGSIGKVADPAPVELQPAVKGKFTWLSTRSGTFVPAEPLALSTTYRFAFRNGLKDAGGEKVDGDFDATFQTPGLTMKGWNATTYLYRESVTALPSLNLLFNADVNAADAAASLSFVNSDGTKIAAKVEQADPVHRSSHRFPAYRSADQSVLTWKARFLEKISPSLGGGTAEVARQNQLFVSPATPLTVGDDWKLAIAAGLPSTEAGVNLLEPVEIPIGNVTAFKVRKVESENNGHGGRKLIVNFSKALAGEVKAENVQQWIHVTPAPKGMTATVDASQVTFSGAFKLETEYKVEVARGIAATEPFTLAEPYADTVTFEPIEPSLVLEAFSTHQLSSGTRNFMMKAVNIPKIRVTAKLFQPETAPIALKAYDEYLDPPNSKPDEFHRRVAVEKLPGKTIYSRIINGTLEVDTERAIKIAWSEILGPGKSGVVLITAEQAGRSVHPGVQAVVQVTDLGVVWKRSTNETFAHVFSLATGAPVAGVKLNLLTAENLKVGEAKTDATGMAILPAATKARWLRAESGGDLHLVALDDDTNRLSLYRFHIPYNDEDDDAEAADTQVFLFTERGVYRPGETVHLKGIVRDPRTGQTRVPAGLHARLKAYDNREREILSREITLNAYGALDADIPLPKGTLGTYSATISLAKKGVEEVVATHEFEVQEYVPNAFEISIEGPKTVVGAQPLEIPLAAKYLMGKSLSKAQVSWSIEAEDRNFTPEGFGDFSFCDAIDDYRLNRALDRASHFSDQGKLDLGEDGRATVNTSVQLNPKAPQPRNAHLLAEVTDVNQQTVSQATDIEFHASDFYLGIGKLPEVVQKGDQLPVPVVAVRTDGTQTPEPVEAKLRVTRIDWQNNRVVTDEDASETQTEPIFKVIGEQPLRTQRVEEREHKWMPLGEPAAKLTAGEPGLYMLEALAKDTAGREVVTSTTFYVTGENVTEWNYRNEYQIELVPDKLAYLSGETARILVKTPIGGDALITVERDHVLRSFTTKLTGNAPSVEVPLLGDDAPNVFVSVMLLRGAQASTRKFKEPDYRVGFCQLKVTRPESKLTVYVNPERKAYRPAQEVTIAAEVRDITGKPRAHAEVTLYAVDEGVLSLTGYETPDPLTFFMKPLPLSVTTSLTLPSLLREDPDEKSYDNKGYMVGGGGDLGDAFRKNFVTCALWNANLVTDENGRVSATFTAPDSLTRYRVIAVVQTKDDAFGAGESAFEVNKPVMIEPALPRFANIGDQLDLRAVLHNLTDVAGEVDVELALDDLAVCANPRRQVTLPAHGTIAVDFPVEFKKDGEAQWKWVARFTGADGETAYRDAVQTKLKVGFPVAQLREVKLQRTEDVQTNLLKDADPAVLEGNGVARVSLSNSRVIELRESLNQLLHYPYGCVEQTTSSTLPWIVLQDFRDALPELARTDGQIRDAVNYGIDRLLTMQTSGGGLSYWPGGKEPHFWGSSYGALGLVMAKRAGYAVPAEELDSLLKYLSGALRGTAEIRNRWDLSERALALYTLALAGRAEPAYHEILFKRRDELNAESRALLALAVIESKGAPEMATELLANAKPEGFDEDAFWSGSRDAAIRLLAWCQFKPEAPEVDATVTELLGLREGGHWLTTQGNSWSLIAFSTYLRKVEKPAPHIAGTLAWGDRTQAFTLEKKEPLQRIELPIAPGNDRLPMTLANPDSKRIFTEVELVAHPKSLNQPQQDQGYGIERAYSKIEDDGKLTELKSPQIGDRVLVTLKIDVRKRARYIAVEDPLPSILEAVNPAFKSQETRAGEVLGQDWPADFQELRDDRALFFADYLSPGQYTIRYLARVRAAGTATAPSAKIEEMYHPDRFGLTETARLTSLPLK
jgi:uncharacterized protein YfaS (alpha-2-macroglobulin family)